MEKVLLTQQICVARDVVQTWPPRPGPGPWPGLQIALCTDILITLYDVYPGGQEALRITTKKLRLFTSEEKKRPPPPTPTHTQRAGIELGSSDPYTRELPTAIAGKTPFSDPYIDLTTIIPSKARFLPEVH